MASFPAGTDLSMIPAAKPPPGHTSNFDNPQTLAQVIISISAITSVLTFSQLIARLVGTFYVTHSSGLDDYACILAFLFSITYTGLTIHTRHFARHAWDLPLGDFTAGFSHMLYASIVLEAMGLLLSKLSILLLLLRLFSPNRRTRYKIYFGIFMASSTALVTIIVVSVAYAPRTEQSFDRLITIFGSNRQRKWVLVRGTLNVILDFYILYLPIPIIWRLKLSLGRKVGVSSIFMTGLIACAASATALVYRIKLGNDTDTLWHFYVVDILRIVEINVAIKVACMPACASCLRYLYSKIRSFIDMHSKNRMKPPTPKKADEFQVSRDPILGQTTTSWPLENWVRNGSDPQNTAVTQRSDQVDSSGSLPIVEGELAYMDYKPSRKEPIRLSEGDQRPMRQEDLV